MISAYISQFCAEHENFFAFNMQYLYLVGLWPKENWSPTKKFLYNGYEMSLHVLSLIYLIITGIGTYQYKEDTTIFLSNLDKSLVAYNFVLKVVVFVLRRNQLRILLTEIEISGDTVSEERKKLMCHHVVFISVVSTAIVGAFSGIAQIKGEMTVEAWMPFDPMKNRMNLALAAQILALTFVVPCLYRSFAMQGIVCSIIMYICDQLVELQDRFRVLQYSPETEDAMKEEFKKLVKKHVRLMRYSQSATMVFKEFFLIQNLAISVELCLNAIMVTIVGLENKTLLASFLSFLAIALLNAYIYCYLGNELINQSQGIALAAYETDWTEWPVGLQKDLLFVIRVAQRPLQLSAGGIANMSIQTFSQVLYNGYSIFAVLNDVVD